MVVFQINLWGVQKLTVKFLTTTLKQTYSSKTRTEMPGSAGYDSSPWSSMTKSLGIRWRMKKKLMVACLKIKQRLAHHNYKNILYFMGMTIPVKNNNSGILQWHSENLKTAYSLHTVKRTWPAQSMHRAGSYLRVKLF